jgi:integrase
MAHVQRRGKAWVARYTGPDHRERSKSFTRKVDAERFLADQESRKARGLWLDPALGREALSSFWTRWLERALGTGRPSERTIASYREIWCLYLEPRLGACPVASITRADVVDLVADLAERSAWRASDALKVLRMLLNRAADEGIIGRNPAARVPAPKVHLEEPWVLSPEEVERLADCVGGRWRALVLTAAYSSLRWSELVALRLSRLDLLRRRIRVEEKLTKYGRLMPGEPKTRQSRRAVSIPEGVALELAEHIRRFPPGEDGLVFTAPEGGPVRRHNFRNRVWVSATKAACLEGFPFKNLRHTGASLAIAAGANPLLVAARLGHTSTRMVEKHYVSLFEGLDREIGESLGEMRASRVEASRRLRPDLPPKRRGTAGQRSAVSSLVPEE